MHKTIPTIRIINDRFDVEISSIEMRFSPIFEICNVLCTKFRKFLRIDRVISETQSSNVEEQDASNNPYNSHHH